MKGHKWLFFVSHVQRSLNSSSTMNGFEVCYIFWPNLAVNKDLPNYEVSIRFVKVNLVFLSPICVQVP